MAEPLRLTLTHLYSDLMNVYGDRGNILTLVRRCEWRGIRVQVETATLGDRIDPAALDLVFFERPQFYDLLQQVQREATFRPVQMVQTAFGLIRQVPVNTGESDADVYASLPADAWHHKAGA